MKKLVTLLLAVMMILTLAAPAFADGETESGSITINGVSEESTYEIYKILHLESYDETSMVYSYTVEPTWEAFFGTDDAKAYFAVDAQGYATWIAAEDDATVAAFAKLALAYAKENGIDPVKSSENDGEFVITDKSGVFSNLELGYYLVDSTVGALCGLTTTKPNASINAKNQIPIIEKQVHEDSTLQWGKNNSADIGQTVDFRATISVHEGAENFVLHDKMGVGLTYKGVTKVEHVNPDAGDISTVTLTEGTEYTVQESGSGESTYDADCTFEVIFTEEFCESLETNDKIVVYYSAMLNRNAVIAGAGNVNEAVLTFGEGHETAPSSTVTYTYGFDLVKTNSVGTLIDGAQFKIYDAEIGGNEVAVVLMDDGVTYRRAREDEQGIAIDVKDGMVRLVGFDNGKYYLEEIVTPAGYNKLATRQAFIISDKNLDATFNNDLFSTGSGVHVVNKAGTILPETGGFGTTMFITVGTILVLGAGVLLVTKKRMSKLVD
ncbi:MAG: isopeptide-forming domain-containing fimbrial protein [Ruminococcaceae bacterium]|nr:isopeptide-forming domain-containing fimbrial protein [Oscillospiraceae bacterium]